MSGGPRWREALGWVAAGNVAQQAGMFVATVLVARQIGPAEFGAYSFVQATVAFLGVVAGFGLPVTVTLAVARFRHGDPDQAGAAIGNGVAVGAALCAAVTAIAGWAGLRDPALLGWAELPRPLLPAGAALLGATAAQALLAGAASGFEDFARLARSAALRGLVAMPAMAMGAWFSGAAGAIWGASLAMAVAAADLAVSVRTLCRDGGIRVHVTPPEGVGGMLAGSALPAFLASLLSVPVAWYCNRLLLAAPDGAHELGVYSATSQFRTMLAFVPSVAGQVLLPRMARNGTSERGGLLKVIALSGGVALAASAVFLVAREPLMLLFGKGFAGRAALFEVVIGGGCLFALQAPLTNALVGAGRLWANVALVLLGAVVQTGIAVRLLPAGGGAEGLAWAVLAGYAAQIVPLLLWIWFGLVPREARP